MTYLLCVDLPGQKKGSVPNKLGGGEIGGTACNTLADEQQESTESPKKKD